MSSSLYFSGFISHAMKIGAQANPVCRVFSIEELKEETEETPEDKEEDLPRDEEVDQLNFEIDFPIHDHNLRRRPQATKHY